MGLTLTDIPHRLDAREEESGLEDPVARKVLRNVDGRRDLKRIAATCGISDDAVLIIADDLLQSGLVEIGDSSRLDNLTGRPRGRSSGMYSQVTPSERARRRSSDPGSVPVQTKGREVSAERRTEIENAYAKLDTQTYYQLLDIAEDAPKSQVRDAYFRLSKRFHPDSLFGADLGTLRSQMEAVFQRLTDAYDTLGRTKRRAKYNQELGISVPPRSDATAEQPPAPQPVTHSAGNEERPTGTFKRLTEGEKEARRQLHTRKLLAVTQQSEGRYRLASRPSIPAVEAPSSAPNARSSEPLAAPRRSSPHSLPTNRTISTATRDLARSLKETATKTGGLSRAQTYLEDARLSAEAGDYRGAVNAARLALSAEPDRDDIRQLFATYDAKLQESQAEVAKKRAEAAERSKNWDIAATAWTEYCDTANDDLQAHMRAVEAGLTSGADLASCKRLAQRAVEIAPDHVGAHRLLAKVFVAAGMKLNAKRELKKALRLDPKDKISEDMLRTLG